jgi:N-acetyl-gamma-glutamyl-phosphate reductase
MSNLELRAAVVGATGYTGGELLALLSRHPDVAHVVGVAGERAGTKIEVAWPRLALRGGSPRLASTLLSLEELLADERGLDVTFLCLPHDSGVDVFAVARTLRARGTRVFDVGDAMRATALGQGVFPEVGEAVAYGLPELFGDDVAAADVVACAGCYPTSVLLATGPLVSAGALDPGFPLIVDSKSGTTGAGRKPQTHLLVAEASANLTPYKPGRTHRHVAEMEGALARLSPAGSSPRVLFTPHLLPFARGLLSTLHLRLAPGWDASRARMALAERYSECRLVDVLPTGGMADISLVVGTPGAVLSVHGAEDETSRDVVIVSALDNLLKGAASQAIQNLNARLGLPIDRGLLEEKSL